MVLTSLFPNSPCIALDTRIRPDQTRPDQIRSPWTVGRKIVEVSDSIPLHVVQVVERLLL